MYIIEFINLFNCLLGLGGFFYRGSPKNEVFSPQNAIDIGVKRSQRERDMKVTLAFLFGFLLVSSNVLGHDKEIQKQIQQEFQRNNYKKVIRLYREFEHKLPDQPISLPVRIIYSQALADTGEVDQAIKILQDVLKDFPPQVSPLRLQYDLANLLFIQHQNEKARVLYQRILFQASRDKEIIAKARGRVASMKQVDGRKKDLISLQLFDIETALDLGEIPEGTQTVLKKIVDENPSTSHAEKAQFLLSKITEIRSDKAKALLDEARRLFDEEKKYAEVRQTLEQIKTDYADVCEMRSIEALEKEINIREGRAKR